MVRRIAEPIREERRPREAHVSSFVDDVEADTLRSISFQRISDDEEEAAGSRGQKSRPANERANPRLK